jgi:hypothetical protein
MAQIVLDIFLLLPHQHLILLLHNLLVDVLEHNMAAVLIVIYQNLTKLAQIVLGMFRHPLLHNLSVVALVQFMDVVLIVMYQNLTKLAQIVLGMFLHNLSVVALEHNTDAVLTAQQLKPAHNIPTVLIIL